MLERTVSLAMPLVPFVRMPDDARVWVFASRDPVPEGTARKLLDEVDEYLDGWQAHGVPLTAAREWRDGRFLVVAVDQSKAAASGCSIDALFRLLRRFQDTTGVSLLDSGTVYYRDQWGRIRGLDRSEFGGRVAAGEIGPDTRVFDTTVASAGAYRTAFERPLSESWHGKLVALSVQSG